MCASEWVVTNPAKGYDVGSNLQRAPRFPPWACDCELTVGGVTFPIIAVRAWRVRVSLSFSLLLCSLRGCFPFCFLLTLQRLFFGSPALWPTSLSLPSFSSTLYATALTQRTSMMRQWVRDCARVSVDALLLPWPKDCRKGETVTGQRNCRANLPTWSPGLTKRTRVSAMA